MWKKFLIGDEVKSSHVVPMGILNTFAQTLRKSMFINLSIVGNIGSINILLDLSAAGRALF